MVMLELANMIHGEGAQDAETRHDNKPEGIAVLGFGCLEHSSRQGERNSGTEVLKGVDDSGGKASHLLAPNIHRGGGSYNRVRRVGGKSDEDKDGASEQDSPSGGSDMAEQKDGSGD